MEDTPRKELGLQKHWGAIVLAFAFGLALAGPYILIRSDPAFSGIYPGIQNDQNFYLSRIQDVRDARLHGQGYPGSGNTYLAEEKSALPMQFLTGERVEAAVLELLSVPTPDALILFQFILPPLIFLLSYIIFLRLRAPRFWALMGTTLLTFGIFFFAFARPISPQFNFIFWLIAVLGFVSIDEKPSWRWVGLQAIAVGALFYLYPYYWTHLLVVYGVACAVYLFINRGTALKIFCVAAGAIGVGSGYLSLVLRAHALPEYQESLSRIGFVATHSPSGVGLIAITAITIGVAGFLVWHRRTETLKSRPIIATGALLIGGVIAMNQHVVTGINMEFSSHYSMQIYFAAAFLIATALTAGGWWKKLEGTMMRALAILVVIVVSYNALLPAYAIAQRSFESRPAYPEYAALIGWMNENTKAGSVIFAPDELSDIVASYTRNDVFYARNANISFMSDATVTDRFIIQNYGAEFDNAFIVHYERALFGHQYVNRYNHALQKQKFLKLVGMHTDVPERIPASAITAVQERAHEIQSGTFEKAAAPYRMDYYVIDTTSPDGPKATDLGPAQSVFTAGNYQIFKGLVLP
jgi:hypothetical protein